MSRKPAKKNTNHTEDNLDPTAKRAFIIMYGAETETTYDPPVRGQRDTSMFPSLPSDVASLFGRITKKRKKMGKPLDFTVITDQVIVGGHIRNKDRVKTILDQGVTHIINMDDHMDDAKFLVAHPEIEYLYVPTPDDHIAKPVSYYKTLLGWIIPTLKNNPKAKVYIHCAAGRSRGPSGAYLILRALGTDITTAKRLIHQRERVQLSYRDCGEIALRELGYV